MEPGKFFIGIVSFFAVLLPGAILTALLQPIDVTGRTGLQVTLPEGDSPKDWMMFLVFAYFAGQLLFAASALLDPVYDAVKDTLADAGLKAEKARKAARNARRAHHPGNAGDTGNVTHAVNAGNPGDAENAGHSGSAAKRAEPRTAKRAASRKPRLNFTRKAVENRRALDAANRIRIELLKRGDRRAVNVYQWARAMLTALFLPAAAEVHGLEAESKFFRSLVPVLLLAAVIAGLQRQWEKAGVAIVLAGVSFYRFYGRRLKGTSQAYWYIIALHRSGRLLAPPPPAASKGGARNE